MASVTVTIPWTGTFGSYHRWADGTASNLIGVPLGNALSSTSGNRWLLLMSLPTASASIAIVRLSTNSSSSGSGSGADFNSRMESRGSVTLRSGSDTFTYVGLKDSSNTYSTPFSGAQLTALRAFAAAAAGSTLTVTFNDAPLIGTAGGRLNTALKATLSVTTPVVPVTIALIGTAGGRLNTALKATLSVTTPTAPDLVVSTPTRTPSGDLTPRQRFTLRTVVTNSGNGNSASTTLRWRRSTNDTISTSDTQVGTDSVSALGPNRVGTESFTLSAPSTPGTYYYGATVDSVTGESNTRNNSSGATTVVVVAAPVTIALRGTGGGRLSTALSGRLTVTTPTAPDLTVSTPTKNVSGNLTAGQRFTLTAVVTNDGNANSARTTLRWRRSTNNAISTGDTQVGTDTVSALSPNGTSTETFSLAAPSTPGTYYYGATVDSVTNESNTRNNSSGALTVVVVAATTAPAFSDDTGNSQSWTIGTSIGTLTVPAASGNPTPIYEVVDSLPSGISFNTSNRRLTGRPTEVDSGTIRIRASNSEGSDDWTVAYSITGSPDLVVSTPTKNVSGSLTPGESFTLRAVVTNSGSATSPSTTLRWRSSTNATITTSDTQIGTDSVGTLGPNRTGAETFTLSAPSTVGTYYYGATVDSVADESNTRNNNSGALRVVVSTAPTFADATGDSQSWTVDTAISTLTVPRASGNPTPTYAVVGSLPSGISFSPSNRRLTGRPTRVGNGTIRVRATNSVGSADWTVAYSVTTPGSPDLVVSTPTRTPSGNLTPSQRFTLRAVVTNNGAGDAAATTLRWWRSTNDVISTSDTQVGTDSVRALSPNGTSVETLTIAAPSTPGTYYYGATVNSVTGESTTTNNNSGAVTVVVAAVVLPVTIALRGTAGGTLTTALSATLTVTAPATAPDLVVSTPTKSPTGNLTPGQSFTLSAVVTNSGDANSAATTLQWRRSTNNVISTSDTQIGTDTVGALGANGTSTETLTLTAPLTPGTYYYGVTVNSVTDESSTTNNNSGALRVVVAAAQTVPSFTSPSGNSQSWTRNSGISPITVSPATGNPTPVITVSGLAAGLSFSSSNRRITGIPTTVGSGTVTVTATNSQGTDTYTFGWTVSDALVSPTFASSTGPSQSWTQNTRIATITVPAANGNPPPAYTVSGLPAGLSFSTSSRTITGTPTGSGSGSIVVRARNSEGFADYTISYSVEAVSAPVFSPTSGSEQTWELGSAISTITVPTASGNPTPTYAASGLPTGLSFNTSNRRITGTPSSSTAGSGTITITASNNQGSDTYTIAWSTTSAPTPTATIALVGTAGGTLAAAVSATLTVETPTIGITVVLPWNITLFNIGHIWSRTSGSPSLGSTLSDDGMERFLRAVYLPASRDDFSSSNLRLEVSTDVNSDTQAEFSTRMESVGVVTFSSGTESVSITGLKDTTEPYAWNLSGSELRSFRTFANAAAGSDLTIKFFLPPLVALVGTGGGTLTTELSADLTVTTPLKTVTLTGTAGGTLTTVLSAALTVTTPLKTVALVGTAGGTLTAGVSADLTVTTPLKTVALTGTGGGTLATELSASLTVTVNLVEPSFADDAGDAQSWTVGTAIAAITVPAASGNPVPAYAAVGALPAGVVFNTGTRVISGTPTQEASGTITVRATNTEGSDDWTVAYSTVAGLSIGDWDGSGYGTPIVLALVPVTIALPDITSQDFTPIGTADIVVASDMSIGQVERHTSPTLRLRRTTSSTALFSKYFGSSGIYEQAELFLVIRNAANVSVTVPFTISNTGGGFSNWQIDANSQASLLTGLRTGDRFVLAIAEPHKTVGLVGTAGGTLETTLSATLTVTTSLKTVALIGRAGGTFETQLTATLTVAASPIVELVGTSGGTLVTELSATLTVNPNIGLIGNTGGTFETELTATLRVAVSKTVALIGATGGTFETELKATLTVGTGQGLVGTAGGTFETELKATLTVGTGTAISLVGTAGGTFETELSATLTVPVGVAEGLIGNAGGTFETELTATLTVLVSVTEELVGTAGGTFETELSATLTANASMTVRLIGNAGGTFETELRAFLGDTPPIFPGPYWLEVWVLGQSSISAQLGVKIDGALLPGGQAVALNGNWQRLTHSFTLPPRKGWNFGLRFTPTVEGEQTVYVGGWRIESGDSISDYEDRTYPGANNLSGPSRPAGSLQGAPGGTFRTALKVTLTVR